MQWPDTVAAPAGRPESEAGAEGNATRDDDGRQAVGAAAAFSVFGGLELPCSSEPDLFFAESPEDVETAKAMCRGCAVRLACLAGAKARREPWGVWGGELFLRGEVVPRKRPRGRPRKTDVAA